MIRRRYLVAALFGVLIGGIAGYRRSLRNTRPEGCTGNCPSWEARP